MSKNLVIRRSKVSQLPRVKCYAKSPQKENYSGDEVKSELSQNADNMKHESNEAATLKEVDVASLLDRAVK